jgi:hypothetical protein
MTVRILSATLACLVSAALCQTQPALTVQGVDGKSVTLHAADLQALPHQTVKSADRGTSVTFDGVRLADIMSKVALPTGEKFHKTATSYYLLVDARDGYRAVFAWAELDPTFMDKEIYLVTGRDGKPLSDRDGPFQLVVPGEKRGGRSVRQVTSLKIQQAN